MNTVHKTLLILAILTMLGPLSVSGQQQTDDAQSGVELAGEPAETQEEGNKKKQPKDPNRGRFLPIPIFITEPAIGEGLGLALTYFHRKKDSLEGRSVASPESIGGTSREQAPPPTVTGVFAAYTSNKTAAAGVGHMNTFRDDHIRFTAVAALADVKSTFYVLNKPVEFNLKGVLVYQETRFRFGDSRWFWGIGLSYLDADNTFEFRGEDFPPIELFADFEVTNVGLSAKLAWDSRDNTSMPNRGQFFDMAVWRYDDTVGGDYDYWDARLKLLSFHPLGEKFIVGLRLEYSSIEGRAPFFGVPWVKLRGIPALRYQGDRVTVAEIEGRYKLAPKWSLIGFAGVGATASDSLVIDTDQDIYAYGLGARYKIFDAQNVWVGIDIARGTEETNWYIQVGHAW